MHIQGVNVEFHYYVIYWLSRRAGFSHPDCDTIAYSSQFVDNAVLGYQVATPKGVYDTVIAQNYVFWNEATLRNAYLPFHFIPAGLKSAVATRKDGGANPWNVVPDSAPAKEILLDALKTRNLYRVGIALHSYADTWAHQNFSGRNEEWNRIDPMNPIPVAGHAQALKAPDALEGTWDDPRLKPGASRVVNRERFIKAAEKIYKYLRTYRREGFDDADFVMFDLEKTWGPKDRARPFNERLMDYIISQDVPEYDRHAWMREAGVNDPQDTSDAGFSGYDKLLWLKRELAGRVGASRRIEINAGAGFFSSRYYLWNLAAKEHRDAAQRILSAKGLLP
jgi:hypothetical protein